MTGESTGKSCLFFMVPLKHIQENAGDWNGLDSLVYLWLVGGVEHVLFVHILGIIIPTDFRIFQRGRYTTNQMALVEIS